MTPFPPPIAPQPDKRREPLTASQLVAIIAVVALIALFVAWGIKFGS
jgi:hypothetical protein